ncbi:hypothetical protein CRUP_011950 [Coryphaenoides rupestris]|nr:hypothetical protein CRUP_011950 [Coryphaenoides rupestris]
MSSRAEEDAHAFLDMELKKLWRLLFLHYPQCSESQREEEEEVVDGKKKEQRRRAIEGLCKAVSHRITLIAVAPGNPLGLNRQGGG